MRVEEIDKHRAADYANKAGEFYETMRDAAAKRRWNAAALAGVHCAISCTDALTVRALGKRSRGERHAEAADLLLQTRLPGAEEAARHLLAIVAAKNAVEYESRPFTQTEYDALALHVERLYRFTKLALANTQ